MKVLLDMPVSPSLIDVLKRYGHEGVHAHSIGLDRAADNDLLALARRENRIIVTADLDFPRLLYLMLMGRGLFYSEGEITRIGRCENFSKGY